MVFFDFHKFPLVDALPVLLIDKGTGKNIIFATDEYEGTLSNATKSDEIQYDFFSSTSIFDIEPRVVKALDRQQTRTKQNAEVFTPSWLCNQMNNLCDAVWFGRKDLFNSEVDQNWVTSDEKISFSNPEDWKTYVESTRLELACGEAPFIVSRYDTVTGEQLPVEKRIGILDRKIRVVSENATSEPEWKRWALRAFQSVYGYEFQGDNLLIARCNMLLSFNEYVQHYLHREATPQEIRKVADIISWNIWQMDGITGLMPFEEKVDEPIELDLFDDVAQEQTEKETKRLIFDWKRRKELQFMTEKKMKFDFVIGNPPYQASTTNNRKEPIYQYFFDSAEKVGKHYLLISPARFLFDAGLTKKDWNKKMLNDEHVKVEWFNSKATEVFPNTDIKGGVAVIYRDSDKKFGAIKEFIPNPTLRAIAKKVASKKELSLESIICGGRSDLKLNDYALSTFPNIKRDRLLAIQKNKKKNQEKEVTELAQNEEYELKSSVFEVLPYLFRESKPKNTANFYRILGTVDGERAYRWIDKNLVTPRYKKNNLNSYKVFVPKAYGKGELGEVMGSPTIAYPNDSATPTFIGVGEFDTENEAINSCKYLKTKFARVLLGIKKVTQDLVASKFKYVPIQNFSNSSDINWDKSIDQIDQQLYKKYDLSKDEINFIETNAKEMK